MKHAVVDCSKNLETKVSCPVSVKSLFRQNKLETTPPIFLKSLN